jgi:formylglycine-generating enzyme required for sulfatase activity
MVRLPKNLGGGCVDSTEVTFAQYQAFLEDGSVDFNDQPNECALNKSLTAFLPTLYIQAAYKSDEAKFGSYAVSGVDWCDARAFCAWSGKKLCGKVGGGALASADRNTAADQWWLACATQTQKSYPYGGLTIGGTKRPDTYDPSLCHTDDVTQPEPLLRQRPVTTTCEGGVPGLYDLSGNLLEWTNSCAPGLAGQPQTDSCALRGGSFNFTGNAVLCTSIEGRERVKPEQKGTDDTNGLYYSAFGFRCCSE